MCPEEAGHRADEVPGKDPPLSLEALVELYFQVKQAKDKREKESREAALEVFSKGLALTYKYLAGSALQDWARRARTTSWAALAGGFPALDSSEAYALVTFSNASWTVFDPRERLTDRYPHSLATFLLSYAKKHAELVFPLKAWQEYFSSWATLQDLAHKTSLLEELYLQEAWLPHKLPPAELAHRVAVKDGYLEQKAGWEGNYLGLKRKAWTVQKDQETFLRRETWWVKKAPAPEERES